MTITRRSTLGLIAALAAPAAAWSASKLIELPVRVTRNRPWAAVAINNKTPLAFLIDTGATHFGITKKAAADLGLESLGKGRLQALVGRQDVMVYQASELVVGGAMRERDVVMMAMNDELQDLISGVIPMPKVGVLGMDFDRQTMLLAQGLKGDPDGYDRFELLAGADALQGSAARLGRRSTNETVLEGVDQRPVIAATLDGKPLRLLVDSGASTGLLLRPDYVKAQRLWDRYPKAVDTVIQTAVRSARSRMVRAESLQIGRFTFQQPVVMLQDPADSNFDGSFPVDGLIGMELLRRFNFVAHAGRRELFLKPSQAMHDVYRHDRAGIWIDSVGGALGVTWLRPGGPAARAGLVIGDKITGWRGKDGYYGLLWALTGAAGTSVDIQVERDGKPKMIAVVLEEPL